MEEDKACEICHTNNSTIVWRIPLDDGTTLKLCDTCESRLFAAINKVAINFEVAKALLNYAEVVFHDEHGTSCSGIGPNCSPELDPLREAIAKVEKIKLLKPKP